MPTAVLTKTHVPEGKSKQTIVPSPVPITKTPMLSFPAVALPLFLQPKLAISQPGDPYEQEADRVADQVMRMPAPTIQRTCATCVAGGPTCPTCKKNEGDEGLVQRRTAALGNSSTSTIPDNFLHSLGPGQPLDSATRDFFEPRFGHDFSKVRVHAGGAAEQSAREVSAHAYTVEHDMVFGAGRFAPGTNEGRRLLAHELTHVVQQRNAGRIGETELTEHNRDLGKEAGTFASPPDYGPTPDTPVVGTRLVLSRKEVPPPAPETEDCSDEQTEMLKNHLNGARTWVNAASPKVASYAYFNANPRVSAVPKNPEEMNMVRDAIRDNFHTTKDGVLSIRDGFQELRTALNGSITFECEDEGCTDRAYIRGAIAPVRRLGDIHVCPPWFNCKDYYRRVTTLIHERAHQYPGATDNAYDWQSEYATLSVEDAIDNAESYAVAARQIYHDGGHGPGTTQC